MALTSLTRRSRSRSRSGCIADACRSFARAFPHDLLPTLADCRGDLGQGQSTLFYAEGKWDAHLDAFAELPDGAIVYHIDRGDYRFVHEKLGAKFCLSGGVPNALLAFGTPEKVRAHCKDLIDTCAGAGGFIMDASAIMQNDATVENVRAMTEFTREYGVYSGVASAAAPPAVEATRPPAPLWPMGKLPPGACVAWEEKRRELAGIPGDAALCKRIWEDVDSLAYYYIWHMVLSF